MIAGSDPPPPTWTPGPNAVRFMRSDPGNAPATRVAQHGTTPFVAEIDGNDVAVDRHYRAIGHAYLKALDDFLREDDGTGMALPEGLALPNGWLDALNPGSGLDRPLKWLRIWPRPDQGITEIIRPEQPLASWRLIRHLTPDQAPAGARHDTTIILVAADTIHRGEDRRDEDALPVSLNFGLRIPMIVRRRQGGGWQVRVCSMTAELPFPPYRSITELLATRGMDIGAFQDGNGWLFDLFVSPTGNVETFDVEIADSLQLEGGLVFDDFRLRVREENGVPVPDSVEVIGKGFSTVQTQPRPVPYAFTARIGPDEDGKLVLGGARKRRLITHAVPPGSLPGVFVQDPASWRDMANLDADPGDYDWPMRRPTRSDAELRPYRVPPTNGPEDVRPLDRAHFRVRNCPDHVRDDPDNMGPKQVRIPGDRLLSTRDNDFSAMTAFSHCRRFYDTVAGFGIDMNTLVVATEPILQVFYRAGITPGPGKDGQTVNAQVTIDKPNDKGFRVKGAPTIRMHLALGNLSHRARPAPYPSVPTWAEPIGIAASMRWMWHEFGHVLLAGRLGQLEFDFAHSAGDAMAAVASDPFSRLADPRGGVGENFRGFTFPWVFIPRRHDRPVSMGWSWSGALNRSLLDAPGFQKEGRKGYIAEQILSSTLFRLYRVLGGDTVRADGAPNFALRERASLLVLYLLIEAVRSMAQSPSVAEALEEGMEVADIGLTTPLAFAPLSVLAPPASGIADGWTGGRASKAVRWAFEAQGMYPPDRQVNHNEPGETPAVDLYIPDRRPLEEATSGGIVVHDPGGYVPVSLDWDGDRLWQAAAPMAAAPFAVPVGNRGIQPASGITLRAWVGLVTGDPTQADWDMEASIEWITPFGPADLEMSLAVDESASTEVAIDDAIATAQDDGSVVVLVEVSCADDRANSDPLTGLPTAIAVGAYPPVVPRHLADLVANDNNLALWLIPPPG